ncbi:MAG: hypothetical protein V2I32_01045, partial [Desulforhopalus sp.]|nr:hypothetical protein [Desulforhopalus sp.]
CWGCRQGQHTAGHHRYRQFTRHFHTHSPFRCWFMVSPFPGTWNSLYLLELLPSDRGEKPGVVLESRLLR